MKLEISIHCHLYQRRLCWMLSSILQQKGDIPEILVSLSYVPNNGEPTTEDVSSFFKSKGMNILDIVLKDGQEGNRAIPRNIRAKDTESDWILYADCDHVYDPWFFDDIKKQLQTEEYRNETKVIGGDRISLNIPYCVNYFENEKNEYPCEIDKVAKNVSKWPVKWVTGKHVAPGNFQLANS